MGSNLDNRAVLDVYEIVAQAINECEKEDSDSFCNGEDVWHYAIEKIEGCLINKVKEVMSYNPYTPQYIRSLLHIVGVVFSLLQKGKELGVGNKAIVMFIKQTIESLVGGKVMVWVNVYRIERVWGGPEEGGWWYNINPLQEAHNVPYDEAQKVVKKLQKEYGTGEGNIYSMRGGYEIDIRIEGYQGESEDVQRQTYC